MPICDLKRTPEEIKDCGGEKGEAECFEAGES